MQFLSPSKPERREALTAYLFLMPFLLTYGLFLVYPFAKGVWISLYDWNLLKVSFNPDAKTFVGLENYVRLLWGREMQWSFWARPLPQFLLIASLVLTLIAKQKKRITTTTLWFISVALVVLYVVLGWAPGDSGRWYDRRFWPTVGNTLLFVSLTVPLVTGIALALAAMLNQQTKAMAVYRTIFFLSQILSVTVVTLIWQIMFSPSQGMLASLSQIMGQTPIAWLTNPDYAMAAIVIASVWWSIGIAMILFLAGLQEISKEMYEAARLDNAGPIAIFWYITIPNMKRTITLVLVLQIIMHFQVFGQAHLMTNGGPNDTTQVWVRYIYQTAFRDSDLGRASAMAIVLFIFMSIFSLIQVWINREQQS